MQLFRVFGLMTGLTLVLVGAGAYFGGSGGAILMFVIAAVMNVGSYWMSDKLVLRMYEAQIVGREQAPELYPMNANAGAAKLAIVNPLSGRRGLGLTKLLATHPPTEERVARLRQLA